MWGVCGQPRLLLGQCWVPCGSRLGKGSTQPGEFKTDVLSHRQHPACLLLVPAASGEDILAPQRTSIQQTLRKVLSPLLTARVPEAFLEEAPLSPVPGACTHWFTLPNSLLSGGQGVPVGLRLPGCVASLLSFGSSVACSKLLNLSEPHASSVKRALE